MEPTITSPVVATPPSQPKASPILIILLIIVLLLSTAVAAFLYIQNLSLKSQLANLTATPTPVATPTPNTPNLLTYTSEKFGVSFSYPSNWKVSQDTPGQALKLQPQNAPNEFAPAITIAVWSNPDQKSFAQLDKDAKKEGPYYGNYDPSLPSIIVGGEKTLYQKDQNCEPLDCDVYTLLHDKQIFQMHDLFISPGETTENKASQRAIFDQILSTFKFISTPNSSWKTYINSEIGYQYSYPPSWKNNEPCTSGTSCGDGPQNGSSVGDPNAKYPDGLLVVNYYDSSYCVPELTTVRSYSWKNLVDKQITIGGEKSTLLQGQLSYTDNLLHDRKNVLVTHGKTCYEITSWSYQNLNQEKIFDTILSSFKFTK